MENNEKAYYEKVDIDNVNCKLGEAYCSSNLTGKQYFIATILNPVATRLCLRPMDSSCFFFRLSTLKTT